MAPSMAPGCLARFQFDLPEAAASLREVTGLSRQHSPNRYCHQILAASCLSTVPLAVSWTIASGVLLRTGLSAPPAILILMPIASLASLLGLVPVVIYGTLTATLAISFLLQKRSLARPQLLAALILALVFFGLPLAFVTQIPDVPPLTWVVTLLFLALQVHVAVACALESSRQNAAPAEAASA